LAQGGSVDRGNYKTYKFGGELQRLGL